MRAAWEIKKFGDACALDRIHNKGAALRYVGLEDIVSGGGEFTGSKEPKKVQSSTFRFTSDHILYGRLRPYLNKVFLPDFDGHCSTEIFPIRPLPNANRRYLFYWLSMDATVKEINLTSTGARMPRANVDALLEFPIPLPPLPEQERVVAFLDEAFSGLATATANVEKNIKNARELFDSYLNSVFANGKEEWPNRQLGKVCSFVRGPFGGSLKKSIFVERGFAVYEQQHAIYDQFDDVRYFINDAKFNEMKRFELKSGDLIMSCSGTMGRVAIAPAGIMRGIINQALLKLTPSSEIKAAFLRCWMESDNFQEALKSYSGGAAIQNVASVKILKEIGIPLPSVEMQLKLVLQLDVMARERRRLEVNYSEKLDDLTQLKQSILQKAFSGELTPPPSQAIKEAAE